MTPYSCCIMPRIQTTAVIWYSGRPTRLPRRSSGLLDAGVGAHVDAGMPEQPRHERRNADIVRGSGRDGADVARERQFADVELLIAEGAEEDLLRIERQIGDRAALDLDAAIQDRAAAIVVAARDRYRHLDHGGLLLRVVRSDACGNLRGGIQPRRAVNGRDIGGAKQRRPWTATPGHDDVDRTCIDPSWEAERGLAAMPAARLLCHGFARYFRGASTAARRTP